MRRRSHDGRGEEPVGGALAVLLFPSEMVFYAEQSSSHRRVLTLYNPHTFSLSFKSECSHVWVWPRPLQL